MASVRLIPYHSSFLDPFMRWRNQPSSVGHNPLTQLSRPEIAETLQSEGTDLTNLRRHESYRWFVVYEGAVVGSVSMKNISHKMNYAEIGYGIDEEYQGKGVATDSVRLLIDMAFSESTLRKLIAYVHEENLASCRVLEKLGFTQEGLLREHYIINGKPENEILFGLLKREWKIA